VKVESILSRISLGLRVVLAVAFAGGIAPWLTVQAWSQLPAPFSTHMVVGVGLTRAFMLVGLAWLLFPIGFQGAFARPAGSRQATLLALVIAGTVVAARACAMTVTPNKQAHWFGFNGTQVAYLTAFAIGTSVFEEVLFRFVLLDRLAPVVGAPIAFVLQLGFFTFLHLDGGPVQPSQLIHAALAGCVLSQLYLRTRQIWAPIMLHLAFNAMSAMMTGISIDGVQIYPMLASDNFGKAHGVTASSIAFAVWAAILGAQLLGARRIKPGVQAITAGVANA